MLRFLILLISLSAACNGRFQLSFQSRWQCLDGNQGTCKSCSYDPDVSEEHQCLDDFFKYSTERSCREDCKAKQGTATFLCNIDGSSRICARVVESMHIYTGFCPH